MRLLNILLLATLLFLVPVPVKAETQAVVASGTNIAKITVSVDDTSATFGTNLDPSGTDSNSIDTVLDYQGSSGNQGSYYMWSVSGVAVAVKSNKVWNGTLSATENGGTATSMTVLSGVLKYSEGVEPNSYINCGLSTSFTTAPASWKASVAKGKYTYIHYYCLRVDWDDDPGTFSSTVTYTVTQV